MDNFKQLYPNSIGDVHPDVKSGKYKECMMCLRPIKSGSRIVRIDSDDRVWKPGIVTPVDVFDFPIGPDCSKKIGLEWSREKEGE